MGGITLSSNGTAARVLEGAMRPSQIHFVRKFAKTLTIFPKRRGFRDYVYDILVTTDHGTRPIVVDGVKVSRRIYERRIVKCGV